MFRSIGLTVLYVILAVSVRTFINAGTLPEVDAEQSSKAPSPTGMQSLNGK